MKTRITPIDSKLLDDVVRLMCCAPSNCHRERSCMRVARFARDKLREMHAAIEKPHDDVEQYVVSKLYCEEDSLDAA